MKKRTIYQIILDKSGSMSDSIEPAINGFNEQVKLISSMQERFPEQEISLGLTIFNDYAEFIDYSGTVSSVTLLSRQSYRPNGSTALYDAIGETCQRIQNNYAADLERQGTSVVVVIITDGHENASYKYSYTQIQNTISRLQESGKWVFSYLGATPDAVEIAKEMKIYASNSMAFDKADLSETYSKLSNSFFSYLKKKDEGQIDSQFLEKED